MRYRTGQVQEKKRFPRLHGKSLVTLALTLTPALAAQESCLQPVPVQWGGCSTKPPRPRAWFPFPAQKAALLCILSQAVVAPIPCSRHLKCVPCRERVQDFADNGQYQRENLQSLRISRGDCRLNVFFPQCLSHAPSLASAPPTQLQGSGPLLQTRMSPVCP